MASRRPNFVPFSKDDTSIEYHNLVDFFLPRGFSVGPVIEAAGNQDPTQLRELLQKAEPLSVADASNFVLDFVHDEMLAQTWDTPVLRAIANCNTANLTMLLEHGANPNGVSRDVQEMYTLRFRRFGVDRYKARSQFTPVDIRQVSAAHSQTMPLTDRERDNRSDTIAMFWADVDNVPTHLSRNGELLHSLVMAATTSTEMFDRLVEAGADASSWSASELLAALPEEALKPSMLCVSTPLHSAIASDKIEMLQALLNRGLNPNARALIAGCQALTPVQFAIVQGKQDAYSVLAAHTATDLNLTTPVYDVHLLHFAVAQLDISLLDFLAIPLSAATTTALGHTLLHVACLPEDDFDIQLLAAKVRASIHDVRSLNPAWLPSQALQALLCSCAAADSKHAPECALADQPVHRRGMGRGRGRGAVRGLGIRSRGSQSRRGRGGGGDSSDWYLEPPTTSHLTAQAEVVQRLVHELGAAEICRPDVYGNTALHYLASVRALNDDLLAWLRRQQWGEHAWQTSRNRWGWTPRDLWTENIAASEILTARYHTRKRNAP